MEAQSKQMQASIETMFFFSQRVHFTSLYLPRSLKNRKSSNTVQIQRSRRETVKHKMC